MKRMPLNLTHALLTSGVLQVICSYGEQGCYIPAQCLSEALLFLDTVRSEWIFGSQLTGF